MEPHDNKNEETLGVVCCYFNPCNYLSRFINFVDFYQRISKYENIDLIAVESFGKDSKYRIHDIAAESISVYSDEVYWQKEELLNIGLKELLKRKHKYIAWVDADIEFMNETWISETINKIKKYKVTQLFRTAFHKLPDSKNHFKSYSIAHYFENKLPDIKKLLSRPGEPGYGYGYHHSIFKKFMLYDKAIVGSGDFLNLVGVLFDTEIEKFLKLDRFFKGVNSKFFKHYINWVANNGVKIKQVGVCNTQILVNYHGKRTNRDYGGRETILKSTDFNPESDMRVEKTGLSSISNKELRGRLNYYFKSRDEDDFIKVPKLAKQYNKKISLLIRNVDEGYDICSDPMKNLQRLTKFKSTSKPTTTKRITPKFNDTTERLMIIAKLQEEFFTTTRLEADTLIIDKSKFLQPQACPSKNKGKTGEIYLNFIVENYDNLPELCIFVNEAIKKRNRKYVYILNQITTLKSDNLCDFKYTPAHNQTTALQLDESQHIVGLFNKTWQNRNYIKQITLSKYTFVEWFKIYITMDNLELIKYSIPSELKKYTSKKSYYKTKNRDTKLAITYNTEDTFYVGKNKILQHDKSYYEKLLSSVSGADHPEEEHYLKRSWKFIFK